MEKRRVNTMPYLFGTDIPTAGSNLYFIDMATRIIIEIGNELYEIDLETTSGNNKYLQMRLKNEDNIVFDEVQDLPNENVNAYAFDMADADTSFYALSPKVVIGTGDMRVTEQDQMLIPIEDVIATFDITISADENSFYFEWEDGNLTIYAAEQKVHVIYL